MSKLTLPLLNLERLFTEYSLTRNPVIPLIAFHCAHVNKLPTPDWVSAHLFAAVDEYIAGNGTKKLDDCMGLKVGKGQTPPFKLLIISRRDQFLAQDMWRLVTFHEFTVPEAAKLVKAKLDAADWNHTQVDVGDVSEATLVDRYQKVWTKEFKGHSLLWDETFKLLPSEANGEFLASFPAEAFPKKRRKKPKAVKIPGVK